MTSRKKKVAWSSKVTKIITVLLAGVWGLTVAVSAHANIGTEKWQETFNTSYVSFYYGAFEAVGFLSNGTILAAGHGDGALAVRYDPDTGAILDSTPEWIRYDTGSDYFYAQLIDTNGDIYLAGRKNVFDPGIWKYDSSAALQTGWPKVHTGTSDGRYLGMAMDSSGNIYSVGYFGDDWIINKHDKTTGDVATGFPLFFNPNGFDGKAGAVATDSNDNFIVVGWVGVAAGSYDWYVRKYAGDGTLLWETSYDLKGNTEAAIKVAVDSKDNIIVCGYRNNGADESAGMDRDWYIVKYSKDGDDSGGATVLWDQAWNSGSGTASRVARALLIDSSDNIYIAGDEDNSAGKSRPFLQYRDGQTGALLNSQELSHPVTIRDNAGSETDIITDLALDGDRLVVSGYVWEAYVNYGRTGFITMLELTPDIGTEEWNNTFYSPDSPYNTTLYGADFLNNDTALVSGSESTSIGIGLRYDADTGAPIDTPPEWIQVPDNPLITQHIGPSGSIYFSGWTTPTYKYTSDGTIASNWPVNSGMTTTYDIAEDNAGNVYVIGELSGNWQISKYSSSGVGVPGFPISYDHAGLVDYVYKIAVDSQNNFIVVGIITQSDGNMDWLVRKYSSDGTTVIWEKTVDASGYEDHPGHIIVDADDNVLVSGRTNDGTTHNGYIVKYAKDDGSILWDTTWDSGRGDIADRMVLDAKGNIYVAVRYENADIHWRYGLQYRNGRNGDLLKSQNITHPVTYHDSPGTESNSGGPYIAFNGSQLVIAGYTDDRSLPADHRYTGLVTLLNIENTYNVTTGSGDSDCSDGECNLQAALYAAENNIGMNTVLQLQQGIYSGNFTYEPATGNNGDLTILGGYSADFSSSTLDPTNTILDGGNAGAVLQLNPGIVTGVTTVNGSLTVEGVTVTNGNSTIGGGILALTASPGSVELSNTIIENNIASETGGGCAVAVWDFASPEGGNILFLNNIVRDNTVFMAGATDGNGGGCSFIVTGETLVSNNLVYSNTVGDESTYETPDGGGLDFDLLAGSLSLTNNTITRNQVDDYGIIRTGAGISLHTNETDAWAPVIVELTNTIVYDNFGDDIFNRVISETAGATEGSALTIAYSDYDTNNYSQSPDFGTVDPTLLNNVNGYPQFSPNSDSLFQLISDLSPCIDAGDNNAADMPLTDLAGETRPQDGNGDDTATVNMGCYEGIVYRVTTSVGANGSLDASTPSPQIVDPGATATFTFNAGDNHHIASVSNCGVDYTNTDNSVTAYTATTDAVTENCMVSATFAINQYTVTATAGVNGELDASTPSPQTVSYGSTTQFQFNALTGYHVAAISGCGISYTNTDNSIATYTATTGAVTADCPVSTTFAINQYTVTATAGTNGNVEGESTVSKNVDHGSNVSFTFWADDNYHVAAISGCGFDYTNVDNSISSYAIAWSATEECAVSATFAINKYTVTATAGANGNVEGESTVSKTVDHGANVSFTFWADANYHVAAISGCGFDYTNADNSISSYGIAWSAIGDCAVSATFAINQYTVTATAGDNGALDVSTPSPQTVIYGSTAQFIFNAEANYHVAGVLGCDIDYVNSDNTVSTYTAVTGAVTGGCNVSAIFAIDTYPLDIIFTGNGTGLVEVSVAGTTGECTDDCSTDLVWNSEVTLSATADQGSEFLSWSGDGCTGTDDCTVTMDQAREITATFSGGAFPWIMFMPAITGMRP